MRTRKKRLFIRLFSPNPFKLYNNDVIINECLAANKQRSNKVVTIGLNKLRIYLHAGGNG